MLIITYILTNGLSASHEQMSNYSFRSKQGNDDAVASVDFHRGDLCRREVFDFVITSDRLCLNCLLLMLNMPQLQRPRSRCSAAGVSGLKWQSFLGRCMMSRLMCSKIPSVLFYSADAGRSKIKSDETSRSFFRAPVFYSQKFPQRRCVRVYRRYTKPMQQPQPLCLFGTRGNWALPTKLINPIRG